MLDKIIRAAEIAKEDMVLEIGPGIGTMTQYLAEAAGKVIAVEIEAEKFDTDSVRTLSMYDNVQDYQRRCIKIGYSETSGGRKSGAAD